MSTGGILRQIDGARQLKIGAAFAVPVEAGGTGREDAIAQGTLRECVAVSAVTQFQPVKLSTRSTVGDSVLVAPVSATSDPVLGIALEAASAFQPVAVLTDGVTLADLSGTITAGDFLYPTASGRLSSTIGSAPAVAQALNSTSGSVQNYVLLTNAGVRALATQLITLPFVIDGGGLAITTGIKGDVGPFDFACTIEAWTLLAGSSGSIVVDIWKDSYANFPPVVGDSITASAKPTISSAVKNQGSPTGWTTAIAVGDILRYNVDSIATIQRATLALKLRRN